jgi:hypothetical protein
MPWYQEAMKEVLGCRKLRGVVKETVIRRSPNGETRLEKLQTSYAEYIGVRGERRELKHLISVRKRKQSDSLSSGERKGISLNQQYRVTSMVLCCWGCGK